MSEKDLKNQVLKYLKKFPNVWVYHPSDKWVSGVPDILFLKDRRLWAIELKVGKNKPTKLQLHTLSKINKAGGCAFVAYNLETVKTNIEGDMK